MKTKKVLLIHHSGLLGGAGISFYNTWNTLSEKYEVISYIASDPPELLYFLKEKGLHPKTFPFRLGKFTYYSGGNNLFQVRFWYHAIHSVFQISYWKQVINNEKPDLIIVNSKVLCWMVGLFKDTKSLCFVRETIPGSPKKVMNKIMRKMLDKFSLVSFLSEYDLTQTGLKKARTVVAPDYLNIVEYKDRLGKNAACKELNIDPNEFNVLFVGGMDRLKGIDLAIKAMNLLIDEDITLIVAGANFDVTSGNNIRYFLRNFKKRKSIKFSKKIREEIINRGIEKKIKFIGIQSDMSVAYSACDMLIFPMREPHQARPAFEIGVQKKPVIITDFDNIKEFIKDGENGLTFRSGDANSLATAILRLKNDKKLLRNIGNNNYEYTMKYHTEKYAMSSLIDKIDEILID